MTQLRCTLGALLGLALAACGDNATIVSVNISYADDVAAPAQVRVLLTQGSNTKDDTFAAPTVKAVVEEMTTDVADKQYFRRYDLSGWADGEATLKVELKDAAGAVYMTDEVMFDIEENGAAAAYAEFELDETSSDTASSASGSSSNTSTAPSTTASDASTSADADSSTGDAQTTADDASSSAEDGASDSGDAASTDDASTEDAE